MEESIHLNSLQMICRAILYLSSHPLCFLFMNYPGVLYDEDKGGASLPIPLHTVVMQMSL